MVRKEDFTKRELDVLNLLAEGYSNRLIAERICISIHTVKSHLESIYLKFGGSNRIKAVIIAIREGIID